MGVAGSTPLVQRFSSPVGDGLGASVVRNGDFAVDADGDGMADEWLFSADVQGATCRREKMPEKMRGGAAGWCMALACPAAGDKKQGVMLAQHDVPLRKGQWYRISVSAPGRGAGRP